MPATQTYPTGIMAQGMQVQVRDLTASLPDGTVEKIAFHIPPGTVVAVTGVHKADYSTLCAVLGGRLHPSKGQVLLDGVSLYANRKAFQGYIGMVPADLVLPDTLTPGMILNYEARLRLPRGTSSQARAAHIARIVAACELDSIAGRRVFALTPAEKRRVSLAVELLSGPGLLVIDQPQEGLSPPEEMDWLRLLHDVARQGITLVQATQSSGAIAKADLVLVLSADGSLAWFGPPDEALQYFAGVSRGGAAVDASMPAIDRMIGGFNFDDVAASLLTQPGEPWPQRFLARPEYQQYVEDPLNNLHPDILLQERPLQQLRGMSAEKQPPPRRTQVGFLTKWSVLTARSLRALSRGRMGLLMLLVPLLVGLADFLFSSPTMFDPLLGDPSQVPAALASLIFLSLFTPAFLFQVHTLQILNAYRSEDRSRLSSGAFALSQTGLIILYSLYQALLWTFIHALATALAGGMANLLGLGTALFFMGLSGGLLGCIAATIASSVHWSPRQAPRHRASSLAGTIIVLLLTFPQLLLNGALIPIDHLTGLARLPARILPSHYAFEAALTASGYGRDLANDACWQLPANRRNALNDQEKQSCTCLGDNIYSTCNFPGIHQFFTYVIEQPKPLLPTPGIAVSGLPAQPEPAQGETLEQYAQKVNAYTLQLEQAQNAGSGYLNSLRQSADALANWQRARSLAIGSAEGVLTEAFDHYGDLFHANLARDWLILTGMNIFFIAAFAALKK